MTKKPRHIVCITKNGTNPAYQGARIGVRRIAERAGCRVTSLWPQTPDDPEEQAALLRAALKESPDAIMIAPADPARLDPELELARAAGLPIVSFVSRSAAIAPDCFVTSDNRALAEGIAVHLFSALNGRGRVGIIEGNPASETSAPRTEGFMAAIDGAPGITLAARGVGYYQRDQAAMATKAMLDKTRDLDGMLVANDFMALGVIDELRQAGLSIPVVSVNAMPQAIESLHNGSLLATSAFDAMKIACTATMATLRLLDGRDVPENIMLPVEIVTVRNCAPWERGYEDRPLPVWEDIVGR